MIGRDGNNIQGIGHGSGGERQTGKDGTHNALGDIVHISLRVQKVQKEVSVRIQVDIVIMETVTII